MKRPLGKQDAVTWPANLDALTAADVMHRHLTTLAPDGTVAELHEYFEASASRRVAMVADAGKYVGSIEASTLPGDADDASPIARYATRPRTIAPDAPATEARARGLAEPSRRLPVVDDAGNLVGIVAITRTSMDSVDLAATSDARHPELSSQGPVRHSGRRDRRRVHPRV